MAKILINFLNFETKLPLQIKINFYPGYKTLLKNIYMNIFSYKTLDEDYNVLV